MLRQRGEMSVNPDLEPGGAEQVGNCSQGNAAGCLSNVTGCGNRSRRPLQRIPEYGAVPSGYAPTILWPAFIFCAIPARVTMWSPIEGIAHQLEKTREAPPSAVWVFAQFPPLSDNVVAGRSMSIRTEAVSPVILFLAIITKCLCVCIHVCVFVCVSPLSKAAGKADSLENEGWSTPH